MGGLPALRLSVVLGLTAASACSYDWAALREQAQPSVAGGSSAGGASGAGLAGMAPGGAAPRGGTAGSGAGTAAGGTASGGAALGGASGAGGAGNAGDCPGQLAANPGFEVASGNVPAQWTLLREEGATKGTWGTTSAVVFAGERSLQLDSRKVKADPTYELIIGSAPISVAPGQSLQLEAQVRMTREGTRAPGLGWAFFDAAGDVLTGAQVLQSPTVVDAFVPVALPSTPVPVGAASARVVFRAGSDSNVYFDAVCAARGP